VQLQQKDESFYWCAFRSLGAHGVLVVGRMKHWVGGGGGGGYISKKSLHKDFFEK